LPRLGKDSTRSVPLIEIDQSAYGIISLLPGYFQSKGISTRLLDAEKTGVIR
jgi:hypothetical protein